MIAGREQTIAPLGLGVLRLPVSIKGSGASAPLVSPYFQKADTRKVGTGRDIQIILILMAVDRAIVDAIGPVGSNGQLYASTHFMDGTTEVLYYNIFFNAASTMVEQDIINAAVSAVNTYATSQSYSLPNGVIFSFMTHDDVVALITAALPAVTPSYQTIVSQTGTSAPAVSGGFTPVNSYAGAPTFTWARTGTGVYTLTASSAVFNTSGKTGVFITPPQNLNGSFRAVVTSSTVITVTTAVQSLAVLGLLGFTATPTDALLSGTMIYVQTYP